MNCSECQRLLLNLADPAQAPLEAAAHLSVCLACHDFQSRLLRVESGAAHLPTPLSRRKEQVLEFFLHPPQPSEPPALPAQAAPEIPLTSPSLPLPVQALRSSPRRWWRPLAAAAAAIVLGVVGLTLGRNWFADNKAPVVSKQPEPIPRKVPKAKDPVIDKAVTARSLTALVVEFDLQLAETSEPQRRVEILADLADALGNESFWLAQADAAKELTQVARLYDKVVGQGVVPRARAVPMDERQTALDPLVQRLQARGKAAEQLAQKAPPPLAQSLRQLAAAARRGSDQLRHLVEEATP